MNMSKLFTLGSMICLGLFLVVPSGAVSFDTAVDYGVGTNPQFVAIGDLDGDTIPDLAVANNNGSNISILIGVGNGVFAAAVDYDA